MRFRLPEYTLIPFCFLACACALPALCGCASELTADPATKTAIQSAYDEQSKAYNRKDADGVLARCSPDYEDVNGEVADDMDKYSDTIHRILSLVTKVSASATVQSVTCTDKSHCTAKVERDFDFTLPSSPKDGVPHTLMTHETNSDDWVNDPAKGWLKRRSVVLDSKSWQDGKEQK